jgi:putative transposase
MSQRRQYDLVLMEAIRDVHQGFRRAYGAPRVHQTLRSKGFSCSVRRINRLMKELGIKASTTGLYAWRPGQHAFYEGAGNQLAHADQANSCGVQWAGDFTYIRTAKGWLYHAVVMDLYSRKIVGWSFSRQRNTELTKSALKMALDRHPVSAGCICHSDQGIEYAAHEYRELVERAGMTRSMSRKGNPLDNALVESFFHSLKSEVIHQQVFSDPVEATAHIIEYITFYNRERLHSGLGFKSPEDFERLCA